MMDHFWFLGVRFTAFNLEETADYLRSYEYQGAPGYVSFPDLSVLAMADKEPELGMILNGAVLTLPDGKPSELYGRWKGKKNVSTVSGYWLCRSLLEDDTLSHYFLGSTSEKLGLIKGFIEREYPQANVKGYHSPPFHSVDEFRKGFVPENALSEIQTAKPDLIWVGLSSPKQDYLLKHLVKELDHGLVFGVGGVFDYLSGEVAKSPEWVKKMGLRWLWRLAKEPNRLGQKYMQTIKFVIFSMITFRLGKKSEN